MGGPGTLQGWNEQVLGAAQPYLANLLSNYFGSTAPIMGGTFGGQQGSYASMGTASQLPYFLQLAAQGYGNQLNSAINAMQGSKYGYAKPGSTGLVQTAAGSLLGGMGAGLGVNLSGGGGGPLNVIRAIKPAGDYTGWGMLNS